jgi:hypothetical protein
MPSFTFDEPQFLEGPAHYHDPTLVSNVAAIPVALLDALTVDSQQALWAIQEATSVAYASYIRLQGLAKERFHRLVPARGQNRGTEAIECKCDARLAHAGSLSSNVWYSMFISQTFLTSLRLRASFPQLYQLLTSREDLLP